MKGRPGKTPTVNWYFKDWLSDKGLQMSAASTRGIWANLLMYMYDCSFDNPDACRVGEVDGSIDELCRLGGCTRKESEVFLKDAIKHKFCDLVFDEGTNLEAVLKMSKSVRVVSRRISRENDQRVKWREYKRYQREKQSENGNENSCPSSVQPQNDSAPSPSPSPIPKGIKKSTALPDLNFIENASESKIDEHLDIVCSHLSKEKFKGKIIFSNAKTFRTKMVNKRFNKRAILYCLIKTYLKKKFDKSAWAYTYGILKVENGNFNERENIKGGN